MDINNDEAENSDKSFSSASSASEADSDVDPDCDPSICSLCEATDRPTTDIGDCEELKNIKKYIESTSSKVQQVRFVCQTCLYKLYTVIDQNRLKANKRVRDKEVDNDSVSSKSSEEPEASTSDSAANETSRISDSFDATDTYPREPSPATIAPENHPSAETNDSIDDPPTVAEHPIVNEQFNESSLCIDAQEATDTDNGEDNDEEKNDSGEKQTNNEATTPADHIPSSQTSSQSHLDVMYEQTESALVTESGGALEQYKTPPLQCCFCTKEFVLQKPYNKHMRTHHSRLLSTRSGSSSRGRSTPHNAVHECVDCSATFDSSTKLKTHSRIHLKRYYCMYCHKESLSQFDHDFHEAECRGGHMAKEETVETGRMTRSRARSLRSVCNPSAGDDGKSEKSAGSKVASRRRKSPGGKTKNGDGDGQDDDDDAATSVAYTDYTQLNMDIAQWVAGTCFSNIGSKASSVKSLNISECNTENDLESLSDAENMSQNIISDKEYDIIMLERLINQTESNVYICSFLNCDFISNTLREMCLHEILIHKLKPHFYCRKCKGVFTSKLYLDYHLHLQNYGEYQCNKCRMRFNFEYLLQYHLIQHQKNDSFPCSLCGNSYTSAQELRIHCIETGHDPRKRKKLITIDPTMSIVNDVAPEEPPPKRAYKSTINIMDLPKTPSLQPRTNMKRPKGRSIFLGEIDFVYQLGLNCVRTK